MSFWVINSLNNASRLKPSVTMTYNFVLAQHPAFPPTQFHSQYLSRHVVCFFGRWNRLQTDIHEEVTFQTNRPWWNLKLGYTVKRLHSQNKWMYLNWNSVCCVHFLQESSKEITTSPLIVAKYQDEQGFVTLCGIHPFGKSNYQNSTEIHFLNNSGQFS